VRGNYRPFEEREILELSKPAGWEDHTLMVQHPRPEWMQAHWGKVVNSIAGVLDAKVRFIP